MNYMTKIDQRPVLITGGTGMQGRPTVAETLKRGIPVRALVRDPSSVASLALAAQGAELIQGAFEDSASLDRAVNGVRGVFSILLADPKSAPAQQVALVNAALKAGVEQFVQSTVSSTGMHQGFMDWDKGRWLEWYWLDKDNQEKVVRKAGFRYFTMIRPAMLMDNFLPYTAKIMQPELLKTGQFVTATRLDVPVAYVSSKTVGTATAVAFEDPKRFHNVNMELADDMVSNNDIAKILSDVTGKLVKAVFKPYDEQVADGVFWGIPSSQDWLNEVGYAARPEMLKGYGIEPLSFRAWSQSHAGDFQIGSNAHKEK
jgi:uncharacterized protein YbjT (DUF2867 family)